jgi:hypothetical protein
VNDVSGGDTLSLDGNSRGNHASRRIWRATPQMINAIQGRDGAFAESGV